LENNWSQELSVSREIILKAGNFIREASVDKTQLQIDHKGLHDFVTQVDRQSEQLICEHLSRAFPEYGIMGEEGASEGLDREYIWLVDPLDGTSNFIHGYPAYAVSIGLVKNNRRADSADHRFPAVYGCEPVVGLIYDICQDKLYSATKCGGAFAEDISSSLPKTRLFGGSKSTLDQAFIASGFPIRYRDLARLYLEAFEILMPVSAGLRRGGSAALDLAYTAAGVFDGFFELYLSPWDLAAGILLVEESGGLVKGLSCDPLADGSLLAGNPEVVEEMKLMLQDIF
jgi:myo-inositol-1(or 4)-monophosphatase